MDNRERPRKTWTSRRIAIAVLVGAGALYVATQAAAGAPFSAPLEAPGGAAASKAAPDDPLPAAAAPGIQLINRSLPTGAKKLNGITGTRLDPALTVQVLEDGKPVPGRELRFLIVAAPLKAEGQALSAASATTDEQGRATVELDLGSEPGEYVVGAFLDGTVEVEPLRFLIDVRGGTWVMFLLFGLLGGLGIFLLGMELTGDGLKAVAGDRMRDALAAITSNRVLGLLLGVVITTVLQSSSASTVLLVGFVEATMLTLGQAIGVTLGAKIGSTVTVQLIAFNLSDYALALVALGFLLRVVGKRKGIKQAGVILLGFGFLFFGLGLMGGAMRPLRTVPAFTELLISFGETPILGVVAALAFTAVIQSSAATVSIAMALALAGILPLEGALSLAMGAHIGTCATALLSSLGTGRAGKQVAVAHLLLSIVGVALALPFSGYLVEAGRWVTAAIGSDSPAREVANTYMLFATATGFALLPFAKPFERLTLKLLPSPAEAPPFGPKFINDVSLDVPVLALEQAHRELLRLAGIVRGMLERSIELLAAPSAAGADAIAAEDDKVDILEKAIRPFLAQLAHRGLDARLSAREHGYIYILQDLEGTGDVLTKEIAAAARKLSADDLVFSEAGLADLRRYHGKLLDKFDRIQRAIETSSRELAEQTVQLGFKERMLERQLREAHLERLHGEQAQTVATSALHLSVLNNFRAIGEKLENIARTILEEL